VAPTVAVILVAAGSGARLGRPVPKAFVELAGSPILARAIDGVLSGAEPAQVILVVPAELMDEARSVAVRAAGPAAAGFLTIVAGGPTRQASVAAGLSALAPDVDTVLVHDAARCLTPPALFDRVVARVRETGRGVIPALPVTDTVKRVSDDVVQETVDRSELRQVQTPQGFPRVPLLEAYSRAEREYTDDAAVVAAAGLDVLVVEGSDRAFKITTPWDLQRAERLLAEPAGALEALRTGIGVDVHAYDIAVPLWLGGVHWPDEPGLAGHSDGDAVAHAICDALLSAAGLGDIGGRFGTAEERFKDARGDVFLNETLDLVTRAGYRVGNVAVQLIANAPRFAPRRAEIERHLSELLGAPVSVSATTTDGLGFPGRGEGVTAIATALLLPAR
jgi:2-C-methyl-D-erythritol 4-phosphate cytidylyltransferase/2-C-methyl-D-erythritol 2,4-cyclodiphosphate synthase